MEKEMQSFRRLAQVFSSLEYVEMIMFTDCLNDLLREDRDIRTVKPEDIADSIYQWVRAINDVPEPPSNDN